MADQMGGVKSAATLALVLTMFGCAPKTVASGGPQGWTPQQQSDWYSATQGSRLIPQAWAQALAAPGAGGEKFFDPAYFARFRLLARGPGELPVGVAIDRQDDRSLTVSKLRWVAGQPNDAPWLGFNCSACHTGEISYKGSNVRIDGGPGLTDFQGLVDTLDTALAETRAQPAKWDAFAKAVLGAGDTPAARTMLGDAVDRLRGWNAKIAAANAPMLTPGFARVDAFGHIFNKVALLAGPDAPKPNPSDAPVSYPFLWNTAQADRVQWNGIAENLKATVAGHPFDYGALARNTGEVIGVYGDVAVTKDAGLHGYKSSARVGSIADLERVLALLRPPTWPAALLGTPDAAKVAAGRALFGQHCAACHTPLAHDDIKTPFVSKISQFTGAEPPGTDPWMACNAYTYAGRTGLLEGSPDLLVALPGTKPVVFGETAPMAQMLKAMVVGTLAGQKGEIVQAAAKAWLDVPPRPQVGAVAVAPTRENRLKRCMTEANRLLGYRARPLTGIWATAPYLHNGSVPTLWDLLLPPDQRPTAFNLGSRDFDPVKVGYVTGSSPANSFRFVARDANGPVAGNSNAGHDYGNAGLSDADRWALIEYMKTL